MLWACILLPQLALDAVLRRQENPDTPLVLIGGSAQRRAVQALNPAARALGLRVGQSLTAAHALTRNFIQAPYDTAEIERWQRFLAAWAYRYSSQVSLCYPRALVMEVESAFSLFGPWPTFEARLREELTALGFQHRIVLAPNPAAARVLANAYDGLAITDPAELHATLARLPIDRIGLPREAVSAFSRMGLRRLQQVSQLPRATLARRFAADVLLHIDTLNGLRPMALECYQPPDFFDVRIELNFDVAAHQALLFPLRRLINDLAAFLAGRDSGVQRFVVHLEHAEIAETRIPVGLLNPERAPGMLFELARSRLEQVQIPAPAQAVRLSARQLPNFVPQHHELFVERPQETLPWEHLHERLRARLGDCAVAMLQAQADHRPECSWQLQTVGTVTPNNSSNPGPLRPGWLLREPLVLSATTTQLLVGPERIESGWWDGGDTRRDYYVIETPSGQRGWAYRGLNTNEPLLLQGWFA